MVALRKVWAVMDAPAGKRMGPFLPEIVAALERAAQLDLPPQLRAQPVGMSAATIDRRLAPDRAKLLVRGHSGTKPGSLLKSQIPIRTWAQWDEAVPGFVEIDLVGHEGGDPSAPYAAGIRRALPGAVLVLDHFHLVLLANQVVCQKLRPDCHRGTYLMRRYDDPQGCTCRGRSSRRNSVIHSKFRRNIGQLLVVIPRAPRL